MLESSCSTPTPPCHQDGVIIVLKMCMRPWIRKLEGSRYQPPCQGLEGTSPSTAGPQRFDTPPYAESRRGVSRIVPCSVDVPSNVRRFLTCTLARRGALLIRARESPRFVPRVRGTNRGPIRFRFNGYKNDPKKHMVPWSGSDLPLKIYIIYK